MGLFSSKLVDRDVAEWQFEYFGWLIRNFSSGSGLPNSELWLPIAEHFPSWEEADIRRPFLAEHIFYIVKAQCGFDQGTIFDLVRAKTAKDTLLGGAATVQVSGNTACGTYQYEPKKHGQPIETITYDSGMEPNATQLVATFAHELSHALHNRSVEPLNIDPELYELFTDLTAIYLGYGVFIANSRFGFSRVFESNTEGWQAQGAGYLPEADMIFATAIFMRVKDIPQEVASEHLKPRLQKMLNKAFKQLSNYEAEVEALRVLEPISLMSA